MEYFPQPRSVRPARLLLLMTSVEWMLVLLTSVAAVVFVALLRDDVTRMPALGLMLTFTVIGHMCVTAGRHVAFPDLVALASCLQWVVAPWLADTYLPTLPIFRMSLPADDYLRYAVPATLALWVGLQLPVSRRFSTHWPSPQPQPLPIRVRRVLDIAIGVGLVIDTYSDRIPVEWAFLGYLLSSFRFFGALGWMVTRTPGWTLRVGLVLAQLLALQSTGGLFYLVVHWSGYFLIVYAFMSRWRWQLGVALLIGALGIGVLQDVKPAFRNSLAREQVSGPLDAVSRLTSLMWARVTGADDIDRLRSPVHVGDALVRFNQGWIIARIMRHVPAIEPYARGQTLIDAATFSIVPRFLVPSKRQGASGTLFRRFTGIELGRGTKMGLGLIGEMYANFAFWGGIAATLIYGCLMGWLFRLFADRAVQNPLWWAAAATILLPGVEPGFNVEDIANHVVKAAAVFIVLWQFLPGMQRLLALDSPVPHHADEDAERLEETEEEGAA